MAKNVLLFSGSFDLFGDAIMEPCPGCKNGTTIGHNGQLCLVRDWEILYKQRS